MKPTFPRMTRRKALIGAALIGAAFTIPTALMGALCRTPRQRVITASGLAILSAAGYLALRGSHFPMPLVTSTLSALFLELGAGILARISWDTPTARTATIFGVLAGVCLAGSPLPLAAQRADYNAQALVLEEKTRAYNEKRRLINELTADSAERQAAHARLNEGMIESLRPFLTEFRSAASPHIDATAAHSIEHQAGEGEGSR